MTQQWCKEGGRYRWWEDLATAFSSSLYDVAATILAEHHVAPGHLTFGVLYHYCLGSLEE